MATAKEAAREVLERLPEKVSWNELMYRLYVKQKIEEGLKAVREGRVVSHAEAKRRLTRRRAR
ncbi:MAG TPA: hypothetical protein VNJ47_14205 [Nevskiales bacterium]|nr:hypothetical protein [Nevskiales bacterium]